MTDIYMSDRLMERPCQTNGQVLAGFSV